MAVAQKAMWSDGNIGPAQRSPVRRKACNVDPFDNVADRQHHSVRRVRTTTVRALPDQRNRLSQHGRERDARSRACRICALLWPLHCPGERHPAYVPYSTRSFPEPSRRAGEHDMAKVEGEIAAAMPQF